MPQATYSVVIKRPVDAVFAIVADGEHAKQWRSGVLDIQRVSGTGVGTKYAQGVKGPMDRRVSADYEITVLDTDRRIEFQTLTGPGRPHGRFDFQPLAEGTNVTFALDAQLSGLKKLLMGGAVQKTMDAEVRSLDRLKAVLET
jgi:uncharacterized protein YndB with AHSA1/START domain